MSDKRGLSRSLTHIISQEQHDGQIPSLATRAHQTLDVTSFITVGILSDFADLVVENALLRQQLIIPKRQTKRSQLTKADRIHLVLPAHFTKLWKQALLNYSA